MGRKSLNFRAALLLLFIFLTSNTISAQGILKYDNKAYKEYRDSITKMQYNYTFPIWGDKAYERGYDIPYPWGASFVFFTQRQEINIDRILLSVNSGELVDFSDYIVFGPTIATTYAYTVRPDLWVLPFLNLYVIAGGGTTKTDVNLLQPVGLKTSQELGAGSFGIGTTLTGAVGPVWLAWDNNYNWADVEAVVEPVPAFNSSLRLGHNIASPTNPQRSLSVWVGAFYQTIQSDTEGSIPFKNIFPNAGSGQTIDNLRNWAGNLPPPQRLVANQIINRLEQGANNIDFENTVINYYLDKEVAAPVNMILGAQYQIDKHWMIRTEVGVFGKRSQFLLNLNYRFQGLKRNIDQANNLYMQITSTELPLKNSGFRILAGVLILTGLYSILRYHIFGGVPWHMFPTYVFNKIVCFAGFICLALNYTLGPLRNIGVKVSQGWLNARQTLGISGFFLILFHLFLSLILLKPEIFGKFFDADGGYTTQAGISMVAGIAAFLFLWLYNASFHTFLKEDQAFMRFMNSRKTLLTSFLFTAFHLAMMGYEGWMKPQDWHGGLPPITLVCFVIFAVGYFINLAGRK